MYPVSGDGGLLLPRADNSKIRSFDLNMVKFQELSSMASGLIQLICEYAESR